MTSKSRRVNVSIVARLNCAAWNTPTMPAPIDADTKATLALSSNDQGKAWLNGKQVFKFAETRTLEKDTDKVEVALVKGQNVLVLKVVNEVNNWQGCARFLKDGAPLTGIKIQLAPQ